MEEKWVKLKKGNDWGYEYLAIKPLTEHGSASRDRGMKTKNGEPVRIMMPDGEVLEAKIKHTQHNEEVGDHGKYTNVSSIVPVAVVKFHGKDMEVDLSTVRVPESWAKARLPVEK